RRCVGARAARGARGGARGRRSHARLAGQSQPRLPSQALHGWRRPGSRHPPCRLDGSYTPAEQRELLSPAALARLPNGPSYAEWERLTTAPPAGPWLHRILYLDLKGYLAEGVLQKVDRAAMACSLEVRVPLLDRRVVEIAAAMPPRMKLRGLTTKHVLKWL